MAVHPRRDGAAAAGRSQGAEARGFIRAKGARRQLTARPEVQPNCIGCGRCVDHCPPHAMQLVGGFAQIDDAKCIRCYCCQELCPANAIQLQSGLLLKLAQQLLMRR